MTGQKQQSKPLVYVLAFISLLCWGISYIWTDKLIGLGIPVFYFVFLRTLIAGLLLFLLNLCLGKLQKVDRRDIPLFMLLALLQPFIYFLAESYGVKETGSPTVSSMLIASSPIFSVAAGIIFFREKVTALNIGGLFLALVGICLVVFSRGELGPHYIIGILLLLIAVSSEAGHATVVKKLSGKYTNMTIVMYQFLIGSVYILPLFLTFGLWNFEPRYLAVDVWIPILCLAALCSSLAFALWINAIRQLGVAKSSMTVAMIPVVSALAALIIGREILSLRQWLGIAVAVTGVVLSQRPKGHGGRRSKAGGDAVPDAGDKAGGDAVPKAADKK